ncbi:MAG TPA: OprO/OprP family phosphate-selective porin [Xanthomonadaceae bacterium]|nr:OprO/OprP family phosphate-selective porin [Xanthomonadaceae bacterium]
MTLNRSALLLAIVSALAAPAAHAEIAIDVIGGSEISFEGLLQTDAYWYDSDFANLDADAGDGSDADFGLRRAELVFKGKGPGNVDWVLGYDASGDGKFLDANVAYKIGGDKANTITVGQYKQPNSLEELSSSKNNDFVSKAMITNTFAVGRRLGAAYAIGRGDWTFSASGFGRELTRNRAHGSGYGLRGTWAPINGKGNILNFGLSWADYDTDSLRLRARPDADFANRLIDTGTMADTDRLSTLGFEGFWVRGPFKLQGEYMRTRVDRYASADDFTGTGGYLSGVWNVTGETWSNKSGVPGTGAPAEPGRGMWQVGLRYDTLDLDDGAVQGGRMDTLTAGVNYYWRSNFKFSLNYVKVDSERRGVDDNPDIVEARAQFYW